MSKGQMKVMRVKATKDHISFDPRMSADKRSFTVRAETGKATSWHDFLMMTIAWAYQELEDLKLKPEDRTH
jgi:uncharacterized membrane protein